jgi:hypothetical protein
VIWGSRLLALSVVGLLAGIFAISLLAM